MKSALFRFSTSFSTRRRSTRPIPRVIAGRVLPVEDGVRRVEDGRFAVALYPSGLTTETEVEVDHLRGESMLFEIANGLAMVAQLWNGRRLQSLHLRVHGHD